VITRPDTAQLAELIRDALHRVPTLAEDERSEALALCDGLLGVIARRSTAQEAWMREEIDLIDDLVTYLNGEGLTPGPPPDAGEVGIAALESRYRARSAALADAVPVAMRAGGEARRRLDGVIANRVAHERSIRGDVSIFRGGDGGHA
jgi:hypothetical protein